MPSPVLALPWGSRSTSSTWSPTAARAVARLIAVVVLPTPPFWLAMAKTCRSVGADSEDDGVTIGYADEGLVGNVPVLHGLPQFVTPAFPFVEKANSGIQTVPIGPSQQLGEWRKRAGRDHVGLSRGRHLDSGRDDADILEAHFARCFDEEGRLSGVCLDQSDIDVWSQRGHDQP